MAETFTVALIGPDGAGKSTVADGLPAALPLPMKAIYMGVNLDASPVMLPTTRLVLAVRRRRGSKADMVASTDPRDDGASARGRARSLRRRARDGARLANWIAEECFRQLLATYHKRRGRIVVFDRHFFADYYAFDVVKRPGDVPLTRRLHGAFLDRVYPKPDLAICLDAPGDVLYARKPEAPSEWLERRRRDYLQLASILPNVVVVDASRAPDEVMSDVVTAIVGFRGQRRSRDDE